MRKVFPEHERRRLVDLGVRTLWSSEPEGAEYLTYLRERRHLSDDTIRKFNFGYVPIRANHPELSGRLIMPLYDSYGELVAITSRDIRENAFQKHWHESFDKSYHLYGLNVAKQAIMATRAAIVVEGQFDVGYLHSIGLTHSVAICGSSMTLFQAALLARYCKVLYLFFDGDEAGIKATKSSMQLYHKKSLANDMLFVPVPTPTGKDPDDLTKNDIISLCLGAKHKVTTNV